MTINAKDFAESSSKGQKEPPNPSSPLPPHSRCTMKRKAPEGSSGQSIEIPNDVTSVSAGNLKEEEQLFSWYKIGSGISEISFKAPQEEKIRQYLNKMPPQKKISGTAKMPSNTNGSARSSSSQQKKLLDSNSTLPPLPRCAKKRKNCEDSSGQSIENLNDVIAVSAVNLENEEQQLFSCHKIGSMISETLHKAAPQEDSNKLFLNKMPLQKKLSEIMAKFDLKNFSNDVEPCLSQYAERRLSHLISNCIRMSKERIDSEKSRHNIIVTSDDRDRILVMNRKIREEWVRKQAEPEKHWSQNAENNSAVDVLTSKEGCKKSQVVAKDDKSAANEAIRMATGGSDAQSRWQRMAQTPQKKGNGNLRTSITKGRGTRGVLKTDQAASISTSGEVGKLGKREAGQIGAAPRTISIKDVISVLEKEPQMAKSSLLYRLYERTPAHEVAKVF